MAYVAKTNGEKFATRGGVIKIEVLPHAIGGEACVEGRETLPPCSLGCTVSKACIGEAALGVSDHFLHPGFHKIEWQAAGRSHKPC